MGQNEVFNAADISRSLLSTYINAIDQSLDDAPIAKMDEVKTVPNGVAHFFQTKPPYKLAAYITGYREQDIRRLQSLFQHLPVNVGSHETQQKLMQKYFSSLPDDWYGVFTIELNRPHKQSIFTRARIDLPVGNGERAEVPTVSYELPSQNVGTVMVTYPLDTNAQPLNREEREFTKINDLKSFRRDLDYFGGVLAEEAPTNINTVATANGLEMYLQTRGKRGFADRFSMGEIAKKLRNSFR